MNRIQDKGDYWSCYPTSILHFSLRNLLCRQFRPPAGGAIFLCMDEDTGVRVMASWLVRKAGVLIVILVC